MMGKSGNITSRLNGDVGVEELIMNGKTENMVCDIAAFYRWHISF
jgi:hypothetical protein